MDSAGNVYVADTANDTIRKVTSAGLVTTQAGLAGGGGSADGTGSVAQFYTPLAVAVDSAGNVYVADTYNETIRKITSAGEVSTLAGEVGHGGHLDGTGSTAKFSHPSGVAVDSVGNVYVADFLFCTIRKITSAGVVTTFAGSWQYSGSANGTGSAARFSYPSGVAVDSAGNVYVADSGNNTIRKITSARVVTTLAGSWQYSGSADGTGSAARFYSPYGVAVDSAGNVFVADTGNYTIRKITPAGVVTTLAGLAGSSGSADGTGNAARFDSPNSVAVDSAGNVYVTDRDNNTIRKITSAGVVTTLAGVAGNSGSADGIGSTVRFRSPCNIAVDSAGKIYVADSDNNTIRTGATACPDLPTITPASAAVGLLRVLDTSPQTGVAWQWRLIRSPSTSTATLSASNIRNPTFTPDVPDTFVFRLMVTNSTGLLGIRTLELPAGYPQITAQPQSLTNLAGTTASFSVTASGTAPLIYQWQFGGGNLSGQTNATLTVPNMQPVNAGSYQVVVSNAFGSITSMVATLTVLFPPVVTTQPHSRTNIAGTSAIFSVAASGSPPLTYQWRFGGGDFSGKTNVILNLANVQPINAGSYQVVVSNAFGTVTSAVATLTVLISPSITTQPQDQTNLAGTTASFSATASGTAPLSYQWQFGGGNLDGQTNATLTLANVQPVNAGSYQVVVANGAGGVTSAAVTLTILAPPSITTQPQSTTNLAGTTASFSVTACGTAPLSYQWRFGGGDLNGQTNANLTLSNVQMANAGSYQVVVTNAFGSITSAPAILTVPVSPSITAQPQSRTNLAGTTASFSATASGTAPLTYQWRFGGGGLSGQTNATLTLANVQPVNAGSYQVVVANAAGSVTSTVATLTILAPPLITTQPQSRTNLAGTTASFSVTASGTAPLSYQWRFGGGDLSGQTNATLTLTNVQPVNAGSYQVVVTNAIGSITSATAILTIRVSPSITAQPQSQTNLAGTTANFSVTASGTAPVSFQWRFGGMDLSGQTNATLTLANVQPVNAGSYQVVVANIAGSITSEVATLTVFVPPSITTQPLNRMNAVGIRAFYSVTASGTMPLNYFWRRDGTPIAGANASSYTLTNVQSSDSGSQFSCLVSNAYGMAVSSNALLTVASSGQIRIVLLGADTNTYLQDVKAKIVGTGMFQNADVDVYSAMSPATTPTLTQLQQYAAVMTWPNYKYTDSVEMGNVLADYVDSGGGLVVCAFAYMTDAWGLAGRIATGSYLPFTQASFSSQANMTLIKDLPSHYLLQGVTTFDGGSCYYNDISLAGALL